MIDIPLLAIGFWVVTGFYGWLALDWMEQIKNPDGTPDISWGSFKVLTAYGPFSLGLAFLIMLLIYKGHIK